jgi:uncharacterized cupin superfamily protein
MTLHSSGRPLGCVLDPTAVEERSTSAYPPHLSKEMVGRFRRPLGGRLGIKNFGVNLLRLAPGAWSSQRHWHATQDEMIYVIEGEVVLVTDEGEQALKAGMVAGFPKGRPDGHHLQNRSNRDALVLEIGDRSPGDEATYPDVDMAAKALPPAYAFTRKDGSSF